MSERTAVHEAGHAVVAERTGLRVRRVALCEDGAGTCWFDEVDLSTLPRLRRYLVVALAGRLAEHIDSGRPLDKFPARSVIALECSPRTGLWRNLDEFHAHVVELHYRGDDAQAQIDAYRWEDRALAEATDEAAGILERRWQRVRALADELLASPTGSVNLVPDTSTFQRQPQPAPSVPAAARG